MERILNKDFTGPLNLESDDYPDKLCAVYIIALKDTKFIEPVYVGVSGDLKRSIKQHLIRGFIGKNELDISNLCLYYCEFDNDSNSEARSLEEAIIHNFKPSYNLRIFGTEKSKTEENNKKYKNITKFSSIVAAVASSLAIATTASITMGLFFDKNKIEINGNNISVDKVDYEKQKEIIQLINNDVNAIKSEIKNISKVPNDLGLSIEVNKLNGKLVALENKISALESALSTDLVKSLAVPLLRKDLDNTRDKFSSELSQAKSEIERIYDLTKWFIGLMFTIALSVLGMAVNSFLNKNKS